MTVEVAKAIKTRWDAKSLSDTVTGGIHNGRVSQGTMPYAVWSELSSSVTSRTYRTRYTDLVIRWDVYTNDDDPETAADLLQSILDLMVRGEDATADPLSVTGSAIVYNELDEDVHVEEDGPDRVYRATATQRIRLATDIIRTPA